MSDHFFSHAPKRLLAAITLSAAVTLAGCAGTPPPTTQLAVAKQAVTDADTAEGAEYAPVELRKAREKLSEAEQANLDEQYDKARRLAEQAVWDARVAERKARAEKARYTLRQAEEGTNELREESLRSNN